MREVRLSRKARLTKEQDAMRLQGLRVLARMIAHRLLAASGEEGDGRNSGCRGRPVEGGEGLSPEEKGYVR